MACLDNYILVKGYCGSDTPTTGIYINQALPGITIKKAAGAAEDTVIKGVELLNLCVTNALRKVKTDLLNEMLSIVRFNTHISSGEYGLFQNDFLALSAVSRGFKLVLDNCCRLSTINIPRVQVLVNTTVSDKTLTIIDGGTTNTYTFDTVANVPVWVETNFTATGDTVYLTMSGSDVAVNNSLLNSSASCGFCTNECNDCENCDCNSGINVYGWDGTDTSSYTYGLKPVVNVICDEDKFFCEVSKLSSVAEMVLYSAGILFIEELLSTSRLNVYTIYDRDGAEAQREKWIEYYDELKKGIVQRLPKYLGQIDKCCLDRNSSHWQTSIP